MAPATPSTNTLEGNAADDRLRGGAGSDTLVGGAGKDTLDGGDGDDLIYFDAEDALCMGAAGTDTLIVAGADVVLDLSAGKTPCLLAWIFLTLPGWATTAWSCPRNRCSRYTTPDFL